MSESSLSSSSEDVGRSPGAATFAFCRAMAASLRFFAAARRSSRVSSPAFGPSSSSLSSSSDSSSELSSSSLDSSSPLPPRGYNVRVSIWATGGYAR